MMNPNYMYIATRNQVRANVKQLHHMMTGPDSEKGEGVVGYLLAVLLVIAAVAIVRPIFLEMLRGEANDIDLDLSGGDPVGG